MKITLPLLPEGADSWNIQAASPRYETPKDTRNFIQRVIYNLLMKLHDKAEKIWHWSFAASRKYAPPQDILVGHDYFELDQDGNFVPDIKDQVSE